MTAETDAEFVERVADLWLEPGNNPSYADELARLFALARRGAAADAAIAIIRNEVLEEAARVADGIKATIYDDDLIEHGRLQACKEIAAAIRALKETK